MSPILNGRSLMADRPILFLLISFSLVTIRVVHLPEWTETGLINTASRSCIAAIALCYSEQSHDFDVTNCIISQEAHLKTLFQQ